MADTPTGGGYPRFHELKARQDAGGSLTPEESTELAGLEKQLQEVAAAADDLADAVAGATASHPGGVGGAAGAAAAGAARPDPGPAGGGEVVKLGGQSWELPEGVTKKALNKYLPAHPDQIAPGVMDQLMAALGARRVDPGAGGGSGGGGSGGGGGGPPPPPDDGHDWQRYTSRDGSRHGWQHRHTGRVRLTRKRPEGDQQEWESRVDKKARALADREAAAQRRREEQDARRRKREEEADARAAARDVDRQKREREKEERLWKKLVRDDEYAQARHEARQEKEAVREAGEASDRRFNLVNWAVNLVGGRTGRVGRVGRMAWNLAPVGVRKRLLSRAAGGGRVTQSQTPGPPPPAGGGSGGGGAGSGAAATAATAGGAAGGGGVTGAIMRAGAASGLGAGGVVVAGVAAAGYASYKLGEALGHAAGRVVGFAYEMERANRALADVSPSQAATWAALDAARTLRGLQAGEKTAGTAQELATAIDRFEQKMAPLEVAFQNLNNTVAENTLDLTRFLSGPVIDGLTVVADRLNQLAEKLGLSGGGLAEGERVMSPGEWLIGVREREDQAAQMAMARMRGLEQLHDSR